MLRCIFTFTLLFYSVGIYAQERPKILITYFSQSGNTQQMAEAVARGANSVDSVEVLLLAIEDVKVEDLLQAKGIILGSPVYNGNPAPPVLEFINSWPFEGRPLKDKIGAAFFYRRRNLYRRRRSPAFYLEVYANSRVVSHGWGRSRSSFWSFRNHR